MVLLIERKPTKLPFSYPSEINVEINSRTINGHHCRIPYDIGMTDDDLIDVIRLRVVCLPEVFPESRFNSLAIGLILLLIGRPIRERWFRNYRRALFKQRVAFHG